MLHGTPWSLMAHFCAMAGGLGITALRSSYIDKVSHIQPALQRELYCWKWVWLPSCRRCSAAPDNRRLSGILPSKEIIALTCTSVAQSAISSSHTFDKGVHKVMSGSHMKHWLCVRALMTSDFFHVDYSDDKVVVESFISWFLRANCPGVPAVSLFLDIMQFFSLWL